MNDMPKRRLDEALAAARTLPQSQQDALAAEIMERVDELSASSLSPAQRDEIKRRLAEPPRYADPVDVRAFFGRHGISE
jgi:hypothetical protein